MRVSYLELYVHCKKVFEACGIPYGCAEDGAAAVAWGEFGGLLGLNVLTGELDRMKASKMENIRLLSEKEGITHFEGGGQSGLLVGKTVGDYACAQLAKTETAVVYVQNTSTSSLFAQQAFWIASKGKGCVIHYQTAEGAPAWIIATPDSPYPVLAEGLHINLENEFHAALDNLDRQKSSNEFLLICTKKVEVVAHLLEKLKKEAKERNIPIIDSEYVKRTLENSHQYGAEVDRALWDEVHQTGRNILVESTELSRLRGAGELA
ncbi:DUF3726 domain-containing protein [Domibacillus mangrovi]|uniref:DUF3726 domain-containing protein n=1 Tax=Domibacillus mangrovi TaxID=1714354 RepID=A0A1Q5P2Q1_9BACI|nr:DUF3726 domain-containing protein [Domibacillus mangrovi]OKL36529.1 hypothetical protein BLL40_09975 [Domibacillus mangrovi]